MSTTFQSLGLPGPLVAALSRSGIHEPFAIQAAAIPEALRGRDIQGRAPTGSGKTLAFGLPLLAVVGPGRPNRPRALVLVPTRELAEQIRNDLAPLAVAAGKRIAAIYGGVGYGAQRRQLESGVDLLVATPGRLEDLIDQRLVMLDQIDKVVLDEADRMSDMGFLPAVRRILDRVRADRQTLLFSATLDGDVAVLSRDYQNRPVAVTAPGTEDLPVVDHHFWRVDRNERLGYVADAITSTGKAIVFTRTRHGADRLTKQLGRESVSAVAMHGGRSQSQRERALRAFAGGKASALVATDVAARGIHVEGVALVVHYDLAGDHKDYLHRSGRTGRAGATGQVVTFVLEGQEREVEKLTREAGVDGTIERPRLEALQSPLRSNRPKHHGSPRRRQAGAGVRSVRIFVGNLPWKTTGQDLDSLFAAHGTVELAEISTRQGSRRSKGYGFVHMPAAEGEEAIGVLDGYVLHGRPLRVRAAR